MLTGTREPYPSLRVPATQEKWAATSAAPGVTRMSRIAGSCRLMHQVDPSEKTVAWLILAAARTSMAETDPIALCKGPSAAAPDPWRRRAGAWAAGRGRGERPRGRRRAHAGREGVGTVFVRFHPPPTGTAPLSAGPSTPPHARRQAAPCRRRIRRKCRAYPEGGGARPCPAGRPLASEGSHRVVDVDAAADPQRHHMVRPLRSVRARCARPSGWPSCIGPPNAPASTL